MAKKKLSISIFEIVWYIICALVILWGITYVVLSLINKYNKFDSLKEFAQDFKNLFGLSLYFWGLIIISIGVVAGVIVMIIYAKTFDRAADREQRRSARLNAIKKEDKVVAEQKAEVVEEKPVEEVTEKPVEEEPTPNETVQEPLEEKPAE